MGTRSGWNGIHGLEGAVTREEAEALLGLVGPYDEKILRDHWRRAARDHHPDRGGSNDLMVRINEAYSGLMSGLISDDEATPADPPSRPTQHPRPNTDPIVRSVDRPAFVIDALPVVAFETLLLAARVLGDVVDDDPPYVLEALIDHSGISTWCRLDLVPDAGSSTVSITTDGRVSAEQLCHVWVSTVNELGVVQ